MDKIGEAYTALERASDNGGDVTALVSILNDIIKEVNTGVYDESLVESQLDEIISEANRINDTQLVSNRNEYIYAGVTILAVIIVEVFLWRIFPRIYWEQWLRIRGDWIAE